MPNQRAQLPALDHLPQVGERWAITVAALGGTKPVEGDVTGYKWLLGRTCFLTLATGSGEFGFQLTDITAARRVPHVTMLKGAPVEIPDGAEVEKGDPDADSIPGA